MPLPNQLLSLEEKSNRNQDTKLTNIEETINHYIDSSGWQSQYDEINKLYAAVEGIIDYSDYQAIFGSTNQNNGANLDFMYKSKLANHNILMGIAKLLLGEFGTRSHEYEVINLNPNDDITRDVALSLLIKEWHKKKVLMTFEKYFPGSSTTEEPLPELEETVNKFKATFNNSNLIKGQEALDFIRYYCDVDHKVMDAFYDWVVTGGCYTYKDVINNEVVYEFVPRNQLFILNMKEGSSFVEDAEVHIRRRVMTPYEILEMLQGEVDEENLSTFEKEVNNGYSEFNQLYTNTGNNGQMSSSGNATSYDVRSRIPLSGFTNGIEVFHVVYTTYKDVYILKYVDEFGLEQDKEVTVDYELQEDLGDIIITKEWYTCKVEGYRVLDYYFKCGEVAFDRSDVDSKGKLKSCYNGIISRTRIGEINSIIKDGMIYQRTVNVIKFSIEKLINKNKDKVLVMPYGLVPRSKGISTEKQAYHMSATSILWIDESAPNAAYASQMIKSIDMSLNGIIQELSNLVVQTKNEYWESIGMNAQRYSDVSEYAGKGVTEQAIVRSAVVTYELVRTFDKLLEKDYLGLLDISKAAWINGVKEGYIYSDGSRAVHEMNIDDANYHASSNYNVFVKDANLNTRGVEAMRSFAGSLIQNGASASSISKMYTTNSTAKISVLLEKMEQAQQVIENAKAEADQERQVQLQEMTNELEAAKADLKRYEIDRDLEGVMYTADKVLEGKVYTVDNTTNALPLVDDNSLEDDLKVRDADRKDMLASHTVSKDNKSLELQNKALSQRKNN